MLDTHGPSLVEPQRAAVAQLLRAPIEPDIVARLDAIEVLQGDPEPQRCRHIVIRDPNALASHIGKTCNARGCVDIEVRPVMPPAQEDRQCRPVPFASVGPLPGQQRLRDRHFRDVEFVVEQVALKQGARIERNKAQLDILWLYRPVFQRLDPRIVGKTHRQP